MTTLRPVAVLLLAAALPPAATAGDALARSCAVCHGTPPAPSASVPPIDGLAAAELSARLKAFRDGTRPGTAMPRLVARLTDDQIDALAADVATSPSR